MIDFLNYFSPREGKMLKLIIGLMIAFSSLCASAQEVVLVAKPPVYTDGERATGTFTDDSGERFVLEQRAVVNNGKTVIVMRIIDTDSTPLIEFAFDPITMQSLMIADGHISQTVATDCVAARLYPVVQGKTYSCVSIISHEGRTVRVKQSAVYDTVQRDRRGNLVEFCSRDEQDDGEYVTQMRTCSSPDGKWLRSVRLLRVFKST